MSSAKKCFCVSFKAIFDERFPNSIRDGFVDVDGNLPEMTLLRDENAIRFTRKHIDSQFLTHVGTVMIIPRQKWQSAFDDGSLMQQMTNDMDPADLAHLLALYDGEIAYTDEQLGRLLTRLQGGDRADDTLIIVSSDHGDEFFEHGQKGHRLIHQER